MSTHGAVVMAGAPTRQEADQIGTGWEGRSAPGAAPGYVVSHQFGSTRGHSPAVTGAFGRKLTARG
jgi:hypothetical protein